MDFSGHRFENDIIILNVQWYLTYQLSYRDLSEMMAQRGVVVNHTSIYRWITKFSPEVNKTSRSNKKSASAAWNLEEVCFEEGTKKRFLYRAEDSRGKLIDFFISNKRDKTGARRFLTSSIRSLGLLERKA